MATIQANNPPGFDTADQQPTYIYAPAEKPSTRPSKRRRIGKLPADSESPRHVQYHPLLNSLESPDFARLRHELYEQSWAITHAKIKEIMSDANESTLSKVWEFVNRQRNTGELDTIPTGFVITGPNIASRELLFKKLSESLKTKINGPVMNLRSADSTNVKGALKQLIRDATSQRNTEDNDDALSVLDDGRKLLNYDLEVLQGFVKANRSQVVVVIFQDSEAFDSLLLADLIGLFSSWRDRLPFVLLFGIATSVSLFQERLPRSASRCLHGIEFEVEQTNSLLERIFLKTVAGAQAPLRLSSAMISALMERQEDHVQSIESFTTALKYAYMCHYYFNALSVVNPLPPSLVSVPLLQIEQLEAIRMLPSFRGMIENMLNVERSREKLDIICDLLENDEALRYRIAHSVSQAGATISGYLRIMHILNTCSPKPISKLDLYLTIFKGHLEESGLVQDFLDAVKRMSPTELVDFIAQLKTAYSESVPELDLLVLADPDSSFLSELSNIVAQVWALLLKSSTIGKPLRSRYVTHNTSLRTTVVAQRVQLSYEKSVLTEEDKAFTILVDKLSSQLEKYLSAPHPEELFLNEVWTSDHLNRYRENFTPRPRAAIERALTAPYDYLECDCCEPVQGLSPTHPVTSILYQLLLETGAVINIFDLWSAFFDMVATSDESRLDERTALVMFYNALADLRTLGMVKQSKKKADHLAKVSWTGL